MTDIGPDTKARDSLNKLQKQMLADLISFSNSDQLKGTRDRLRKYTDIEEALHHGDE